MGDPQESLRKRVLHGSLYLIIRQGIAIGIGLVGMLLITRLVGPGIYGLYSSALSIFNYLILIGLMGTNIYLIRERHDAPAELFHLAFWWLLFYGVTLMSCVWLISLLLLKLWKAYEDLLLATAVMGTMLPFSLVAYVPAALLERELDYRRTALIEISTTLSFYIVAIALAWLKGSLWALVIGFLISQAIFCTGFFLTARYRPLWYWNAGQLRAMLGYSISQAVSRWIYGVRELALPLIVLPLAGKEATGYFAIVNRLLGILSIVMTATQRISVPTFARVQNDLTRLTRAVNQAMHLQTLALGLSFVGFMMVAPYALPILLGERWHVPTFLTIFTVLAVRYLLAALFGIQGAALYVKKENLTMLYANIAFAISLILFAYGLMYILPTPYRLYGFLAAEFLAHLPNYYIVDCGFRRAIGNPIYSVVILWIIAFSSALLAPLVNGGLYLVAVLLLLLPPSSRGQMIALYRELRTTRI